MLKSRHYNPKTHEWYYHTNSDQDPAGYTKVTVIVCMVGLLWLFSIYRLSRVWANTLNFDQVIGNPKKSV